MKTYSVFDTTRSLWEDEVKIEASSPMEAAKKYFQPLKGLQRVKRTDYGNVVVTTPDYRKYVYGLVG